MIHSPNKLIVHPMTQIAKDIDEKAPLAQWAHNPRGPRSQVAQGLNGLRQVVGPGPKWAKPKWARAKWSGLGTNWVPGNRIETCFAYFCAAGGPFTQDPEKGPTFTNGFVYPSF